MTDFLREVRPPSVQHYERRYETPPGKQAQVDFAHFEVEFTDAPGVKQVVWLFTMVLGYSRFLWGRFCPNQKLAAVLRCHIDAFADLGGVPEEILYDRMKTVVIGADEDDGDCQKFRVWAMTMRAEETSHGTTEEACYRGRSIGPAFGWSRSAVGFQ